MSKHNRNQQATEKTNKLWKPDKLKQSKIKTERHRNTDKSTKQNQKQNH